MTRALRHPAPPAHDPRRLLAGWARSHRDGDLSSHLAAHGPLPLDAYQGRHGQDRLVTAIEAAGLRGRGGAGFPTATKLRAVAARGGRPVVIANGCEGEPVSDKDRTLLTVAPHLVLDGAELAAHALGATEILLCTHRDDPTLDTIETAIRQRPHAGVRLVGVPRRYVSSEESALVRFVNTGDARPTTKPPRPFERGVHGAPTLIQNVETLAHLALIARYGPDWFRACGTPDSPGTTLLTITGAVLRPGVVEVPLGAPIGHALRLVGGTRGPAPAVLLGGYGGTWLPLPAAAALPLTHEHLRHAGATLGVGALLVLPPDSCGIAESAHILHYLAGESAAQCGPCMFGLPAISADLDDLARANRRAPVADARLRQRLGIIAGRGACAHPDGAVRMTTSALRVFDNDVRMHVDGMPCRWVTARRLTPQIRTDTTEPWR